MFKKMIIAAIAIVVISGGFYIWISRSDEFNVTATQHPAVVPVTGPITMGMVSTHSSATSCWTVIDGGVYDLTGWIPQHPGGERAILGLCGKDGTAAFHGQHDDAKRQADILATFKIGTLTQ